MSRSTSGLIDLDYLTTPDAPVNEPVQPRPDMPPVGSSRRAAMDVIAPEDKSVIDRYFSWASSSPLIPQWYVDMGGSALKATESFASTVGQGLGDLANTLSGGLIDISGTGTIDTTHAQELIDSGEPEKVKQGQRLLEQAAHVEGASREGYRLDLQRNRKGSYGNVDPDSFASTVGGIVGNVAPSALAFVPGLQGPVLSAYFANAYENAYDDYADTKMAQDGDYDPKTATAVGLVSGAIESAFEFLPIRGVKKAAEAARHAMVEAAKMGGDGWRREAAKAATKLLLTGAAQEGIEEGGTELSNEILRLTYDRRLQERYATDPMGAANEAAGRIMKAAAAGAAGGLLLGGAGLGAAVASSGGVQSEVMPSEPVDGSVPVTPADESIKSQAKALRGEPVQKFTVKSVKDAFKIDDDQAVATVALANAMGLDTSRIGVQSGGGTKSDLAQKNAGVWYSKLNEVVTQKMGGSMDADQLRAMLTNNGVKPEEMEWSGIGELSGKVSRQDVLAHIAENAVTVTERELRGWEDKAQFSQYQEPGGYLYRELLLTLPTREKGRVPDDNFATYASRRGYSADDIDRAWRNESDAVYTEWHGKVFGSDRGVRDFESSHFDEPNILAHVRFNERTDVDGKRVLFIEEIQSDWHQKGRELGYSNKPGVASDKGGGWPEYKVPDAPFKKTWHELAMKRMIRYAAENGFDRIAWTTGATQADRYDLRKHIKSIGWSARPDGATHIVATMPPQGDGVEREHEFVARDGLITNSKLVSIGTPVSEVFGKDVASRIESEESGDISGDGLAVGGHGMTGFYDKILVTDTNKIIKRHGAKVGTATFVTPSSFSDEENQPEPGEKFSAHGFDITDSMRNEAIQKGMPLFQPRKGSVSFTDDGKAIIRGLSSPDVSTGVHELFHVARRFLFERSIPSENRLGITDADIAEAEAFSGAKDGKWTREAEEKFARSGERYLRDGKAPTQALASLFRKFSQWLSAIYKSIAGSPIDVEITPAMRAVFDRLVSRGGPGSLMETAFGVGVTERPKTAAEPASRVSRPEAIKALRDAGQIPETTDPIDFANEVATNPDKYRDFIETMRTQPELSRGQAAALFGDAKDMQSADDRKAWVDMVIELADHKGKSSLSSGSANVPVPPPASPKGTPVPVPPGGVVDFRNDRLTRIDENLGDQYIKLEKLVADTEEAMGAKLADEENPIELLRLSKSMRADEQRRWHEQVLRPMFEDMRSRGLTDVDVYLLAVAIHAEEANAQVAKRNPDDPTRGAGMSNDVAEQVRDEALAHPESAALYGNAERMKDIYEENLNLDVAAGVLSVADATKMNKAYSNYVALPDDPTFMVTQGDEDVSGMENVPRHAYSVAMKQRLDRLGREYGSLDDPSSPRAIAFFAAGFAHMIERIERSILRRSQNLFLNNMRRFAEASGTSQRGITLRYEPPIEKKLDRNTNTVTYDREQLSKYKQRPDVLYGKLDEPVTFDGRELPTGTAFYLEVSDPELADTLKNAAMPDPSLRAAYMVLRMGSAITRFGATSGLSVAFPFLNAARDIQMLNVAISADHADHKKLKRDVAKSMVPAFLTIVRAELGMAEDSDMRRSYDAMREDGGILEQFRKNDFDAALDIVRSTFHPSAKTISKAAFQKFVGVVSDLTKPFENMTRLALYHQLRRRGVSRQKSAVAARAATVDFAVHGKNTAFVRAGYAFLNASIQGQRRLVRMLRTPGGKRWAGIYFLAGFAYAIYAHLLGKDRNEDGMPDEAQLPSWQKDTTLSIPGTNLQFPTMWGMAPAQSLGRWLGESFAQSLGKADVDHVGNMKAVANAMLDTFNPAGGSDAFSLHGLLQLASPSITDAAFQFERNMDWRGSRIYNEPIGSAQAAAWVDSQHGMETTPEAYHRIADTLNTLTGGDAVTPGAVDVAPETIRFIFQAIGGGGARSLERIGEVATAPITGDLKSWLDLPIVSGFTRQFPEPAAVNEEYGKERDNAVRLMARWEGYKDMGDDASALSLVKAAPELFESAILIEDSEKAIKDMRELMKEFREGGASAQDIREIHEAIMAEKAKTMAAIRKIRRGER